ncbi:MAG TPA: fibronectin/fibrinogen-binding protein [Lactobacillus sp.]|uniref:Rqc2 homolog RqcH n=1 Tax=Secundilactobacillus silagincola TaxID=1714681 RepID=A0A1Z5J1F2_9LACO|nr:NFACT RNA binding domain-containing protein [Secundilactobacillus silagincola]GAX07875.1 fibronectin-binding protein [Secundilactobacillus silagincola]HBF75645.1 fibronectin/fibrinogen-binding protein [Lactobacillus sp.]
MSFDGAFTHAMVGELSRQLVGGRVSKINQPYNNEVILTVRANRKSLPLLLSANPTFARIQITDIPYVNPVTPTNFTMMMRKYLSGAILTGVSQAANDRVVHLDFTSRNELGDQVTLRLIIEIMARHSNVILIDLATSTILDTIKHVGSDQNRYRTLLPGGHYINPPAQDLIDPFQPDAAHAVESLVRDYPNEDVLTQELRHTYQGLGQDTGLGLAKALHQAGDPVDNFTAFFKRFDDPEPVLVTNDKGKTGFNAFPYGQEHVTSKNFDSLSAMLDFYYQDRAERDRVQQQGSTLIHVVRNELKKNRTKLKKLQSTLKSADDADEYRIKGELLTTYLTKVTRGMTSITLPNFYNDEKPLKIALSNQISPSQNAQKYFKKYNKLKASVSYVNDQMAKTNAEIDYLDNISSQIELAAPKDLADIKAELQQGGYLRDHEHNQRSGKKKRRQVSKPEVFAASDGTKIEVGKNNLQNEKLTLHSAAKTDIWLHVKNMPGSHVIIHDADPSDQTLLEAANIAAYYSKARQSSSVPVDYVQVKKIRKPNGTKPGYVIYEGQKTLFVTPDREFVEKLSTQ